MAPDLKAVAKRVLVTGASGFVGTALCSHLMRRGLNVVAAVREIIGDGEGRHGQVAVENIDASTNWEVAMAGVDTIVHLAARTHVLKDRAVDPLATYREVNVYGSARLAKQAVLSGVRRIVFVSSIKVNGEATSEHPFSEADMPRPEDHYGISKLEAECMLLNVSRSSNLELCILRPPLIYGAGVKGNLRSLMRAIERGLPLPLGAISNQRSLLSVDNLVDAICLCIDHPGAAGETFLVADANPVSTAELATEIGQAFGRPAKLVPVPAALLRVAGKILGRSDTVSRLTSSLVVDSRKLQDCLGWVPAQSFSKGIQSMVRGYLSEKR